MVYLFCTIVLGEILGRLREDQKLIANATEISFIARFQRWAQSVALYRQLTIILAVAALVAGGATYLAITETNPLGADPTFVRILLVCDIVFFLALTAIIARGLIKLWLERRKGRAGARLHVRIIGLFAGVALIPAVVVAVFSALFFNLGLNTWFAAPISTAVNEAVVVAQSYMAEHRKSIQADALAMAADLNRGAPQLAGNPQLFNTVVNTLAGLRSLSEAIIFDASGKLVARAGISFSMEIENLAPGMLERAAQGEVVLLTSYDNRVRALVRLDNFLGLYLYVGRVLDPTVVQHLENTETAAREYHKYELARTNLEVVFAAIFVVITLLILSATMAFGLAIATRLARPISAVIDAAERVRGGDFSVRLAVGGSDDEVAALGRAFNRMTSQLDEQREDLIEANRQLDERRRFTEAVLAGVSAGVIGLSSDGRIDLLNRSAIRLLATTAADAIGQDITEFAPEIATLVAEARIKPERQIHGQIGIKRDAKSLNLLVVVSAETEQGENKGFVITFDDITDLMSAQRTAAWADVARRIAHEIKNPLTPIQLSAERLRRKYLKEVASDPEIFSQCIDTIIRQVNDIGRMVDEFSSFARMPAPIFKIENIVELVHQAVFLQQVAHPEISYDVKLPETPILLRCDSRQIAQTLTNLLKNAAESIEGRHADTSDAPPGKIAIDVILAAPLMRISITDNGRGLPKENRERLTEPYVTTRAKGTGLGLAIVKKIMEEHGGKLLLGDAPDCGAVIQLVFDLSETVNSESSVMRANVNYGA